MNIPVVDFPWQIPTLFKYFFVDTGGMADVAGMNINQHDIVYKVLLGDRNNVNIVHEIFRQVRRSESLKLSFLYLIPD